MPALLDQDGNPVQSRPEIPFIRAYPGGRRSLHTIDRGPAMYALASRFIAAGGRYLTAIMGPDHVSLVAAMEGEGGRLIKVAHEDAPNGPALPDAVDRLVRASVENMDTVQ